MPKIQSAKKALRQNKRRQMRNLVRKEAYKNALKQLKKLVAAKKIDEARAKLPHVYQALDKAAKAKVIEKNKAARLKSQASRMVNGIVG